MKIVVLDGYTENPGDLSWDQLSCMGELKVYDRTSYVEAPIIAERIGDAEVIVTNKTPISKETMDKCPNLKMIAVLATGYNVINYDYAKEKGIPVCNVPTYGTALCGPVRHRPAAGGVPPHRPPRQDCPRGQVGQSHRLVLLGPLPHRAGRQDRRHIGFGRIGRPLAALPRPWA